MSKSQSNAKSLRELAKEQKKKIDSVKSSACISHKNATPGINSGEREREREAGRKKKIKKNFLSCNSLNTIFHY